MQIEVQIKWLLIVRDGKKLDADFEIEMSEETSLIGLLNWFLGLSRLLFYCQSITILTMSVGVYYLPVSCNR